VRKEEADVQVRSGSAAEAAHVLEMPREFDAEVSIKNEAQSDEVSEGIRAPDVARGASRCKHRMTNCPICNPPEAA